MRSNKYVSIVDGPVASRKHIQTKLNAAFSSQPIPVKRKLKLLYFDEKAGRYVPLELNQKSYSASLLEKTNPQLAAFKQGSA